MNDTHLCPVEGCKHDDVAVDRVMCFKHWGMVPRDLQNQVYRWAKVSSARRRIVPEHLQAVRAAIEAVNDKCRTERLKEHGTTAIKFPIYFDGNLGR